MKIIFKNGECHTMDKNNRIVSSIYMENGIIVAVGNEEIAAANIKNPNRVIDLDGKLMLPGFFDSHAHLLSYGYSLCMANLAGCKSIAELVENVREYILSQSPTKGAWVEGRGWNETDYLEERVPDRHDLDEISENHGIVLGRSCSFACVVNTKVLKDLDYFDNPPTSKKGTVPVGLDGHPTGVFWGEATHLVYDKMPKLGKEGIKRAILEACQTYKSVGITSVETDDFELTRAGSFEDILTSYIELDKAGALPIRVHLMLYLPTMELLQDFLAMGIRTGDGSSFFKIGSFKLLADGSLGSRGAALMEPYADDPSNFGIHLYTQEELNKLMRYAFENGLGLVSDGIGDRGIYMLLKAYEPIIKENSGKDLRFGIDHSQVTTEGIIEEYKRLGVLGGCEFVFVASDIPIAERRLGRHRSELSYNWKRFFDAGIIVSAGSDSPVEDSNPILGIAAAVNRIGWDGLPSKGWNTEQRITVEQGVQAYTINAAYANKCEDTKGSLEVGKLADAVVLTQDIFNMDKSKLKDAEVLMTIIDGRIVFEKKDCMK
ncbi:MAG: amidohydrolase [Clostridia bacterium]|nr:amidohydrolase [Clostridia bacterium]